MTKPARMQQRDPRPDRRGPAHGPRMDGEASAVMVAVRLADTFTLRLAAVILVTEIRRDQ